MTELMVVLVIIGILTLIALPRFKNMTTRAKTTEAKTMLRNVHALMQSYYFEHDRYAADLLMIGFEQAPTVDQGGNARYLVSLETIEGGGFIAAATAVVDFDNDGQFNVWEVGSDGVVRERVPD